MGEAKRRGSKDQRIDQANERELKLEQEKKETERLKKARELQAERDLYQKEIDEFGEEEAHQRLLKRQENKRLKRRKSMESWALLGAIMAMTMSPTSNKHILSEPFQTLDSRF